MTERAAPAIPGFEAGYIEVAGWPTWHETHGGGPPVVLLHGGFSGAAGWAVQALALAEAGFRVYVPERRGHAHTPGRDGPLSYGVMAEDTIGYLDRVAGGPAHLVGWSDGAAVALGQQGAHRDGGHGIVTGGGLAAASAVRGQHRVVVGARQ
jgi:pimeloyl-ACP methyl ester carboxylesterase